MSDAFLIELGGAAVGIVARQPGEAAYRFYAADPSARALEGRSFRSVAAADRAVQALPARPGRQDARRGPGIRG
ncbi:hypothetical protein SLNSH_10075 [Alsobacter soli]|uniref:Uncharacterized protein n=1 Tax=Alsobacter soli TaxID=2109933 RepID=A0A2T1HU30_9HYPH|nr:hypothetical protein [Alsobacter soli]PSC05156.1 hypothetical protein SLNSH_10075 [Alsobacter soli]